MDVGRTAQQQASFGALYQYTNPGKQHEFCVLCGSVFFKITLREECRILLLLVFDFQNVVFFVSFERYFSVVLPYVRANTRLAYIRLSTKVHVIFFFIQSF